MKYLCVWTDNCGFTQISELEADSIESALNDLAAFCRSQIEIAKDATIDGRINVLPTFLIDEAQQYTPLNLQIDVNGTETVSVIDLNQIRAEQSQL